MAGNYSIEKADGIVTIRFQRTLTVEEILEVMDHVAHTEKCNRRLWDATGRFTYTSQEVRRIAVRRKERWPSSARVAFLAADDVSFGLMRLLEVYSEQDNYETKVFRDEQKARHWLKEWVE